MYDIDANNLFQVVTMLRIVCVLICLVAVTDGTTCGGSGGDHFTDHYYWKHHGNISAIQVWSGTVIDAIKVNI